MHGLHVYSIACVAMHVLPCMCCYACVAMPVYCITYVAMHMHVLPYACVAICTCGHMHVWPYACVAIHNYACCIASICIIHSVAQAYALCMLCCKHMHVLQAYACFASICICCKHMHVSQAYASVASICMCCKHMHALPYICLRCHMHVLLYACVATCMHCHVHALPYACVAMVGHLIILFAYINNVVNKSIIKCSLYSLDQGNVYKHLTNYM